jgi:hypothetical protein
VVPYYSLRELVKRADQLRGQIDPRLKQLPITQVRVGPSSNKKLDIESIRMMLALTTQSVSACAGDGVYRGQGISKFTVSV